MFDEHHINEIKKIIKEEREQWERMNERYASLQETIFGMVTAVVVSTMDPLAQGGIRWFNPDYVDTSTPMESLPWAYPISSFGGFDDSGSPWVPPAGSRVALVFQNGNRRAAYYLGTIWDRHRGDDGQHLSYWGNYPIQEYTCLWDGRRNGYLVGTNTGDQVLPPWNTEGYNQFDNDSIADFYTDQSQYNNATTPYIKGFKTEEKHRLKMVEGDPNCNRRWKRMELVSSRQNGIIFKDDHLHPAGQWAFGGAPGNGCQTNGIPNENPCCEGDNGQTQPCMPAGCMPKQCGSGTSTSSSTIDKTLFVNPFYKRSEEMRLYQGANTPMQNKCELPQSGIHIQSISGFQFAMDDSVNQPTGVPTWDREFDFGCDDTFAGKMYWRSATGHYCEVNDVEDESKVRGEENGIRWRTATGNFMEMNDHTLAEDNCMPGDAGERRGFTVSTTSTHLFQMNDAGLKNQSSPVRKDGGIPKKADEDGFDGYCLLRSGYGLQFLMKDEDRQDQTANQFILLMAPQKDNQERGPHTFVMQEQAEGPGFVILRAGGVYYQSSFDDTIEVVGEDDNPSNKFLTVTDTYAVDVKNLYFNHNDFTLFLSDSYIFLLAGRDCKASASSQSANSALSSAAASLAAAQSAPGTTAGKSSGTPCVYNPIVSKDPWVCPYTNYVHYGILGAEDGTPLLDSRSERVFMAAGKEPGDPTSDSNSSFGNIKQ